MILNLGETYIDGHSSEKAQKILAACDTLGLPLLQVRTTDSGFIVPNEVADELERMSVPAWAGESAVF